jgi:hypothetical protein
MHVWTVGGQVMAIQLRVHKARHHTGAGDGGRGTAWFREQSSAPISADTFDSAPRPEKAAPAGNGPDTARNIVHAATAPLLDLRAGNDQDSLHLLTIAAASALPGIGCDLDSAVALPRVRRPPLVAGTSERGISLVGWDLETGHGPVSQALAGQSTVIVNRRSSNPRWGTYWGPMGDAGYRSVVSVRLALNPGTFAALTLLADKDDVFRPGVLARLQAFCEVAGRSFTMASDLRTAQVTADQLRQAMQGRTSIDVACGVIMGQNRCSYEDAFQILAKAASHRNIKARVVAETLLSDLPGGAPSTHFKA